jgi:hypothetical protein
MKTSQHGPFSIFPESLPSRDDHASFALRGLEEMCCVPTIFLPLLEADIVAIFTKASNHHFDCDGAKAHCHIKSNINHRCFQLR